MQPLIQYGTMQMLVESLLDGFVTTKDILSSGTTGIGTGEGVDGELIILGGQVYQVDGYGIVHKVNPAFPIVYADIHQDEFILLDNYDNVSLQDIRQFVLEYIATQNLFFAIKITGDFDAIEVRSASKSVKPYPGLQKIAEQQHIFKKSNVSGTMIGYFTPQLYQGVGVPGYHQHFLSSEFDFGGHVLNAHVESADVSLQILSGINIKLPTNSEDYQNANLNNLGELHRIIQSAE